MRTGLLLAMAIGSAAAQSAPPGGPVVFALDGQSTTIAALATDAAGNMYVTGFTSSGIFPTTAGVVQPDYGGGLCGGPLVNNYVQLSPCDDAFVVKLDPAGQTIFSTYLGGDDGDFGSAITVDAGGNIYVAGSAGRHFPTTPGAAFSTGGADGYGGFVAKLSPSGDKLIYSTYVPGLSATALAIDAAGNAYVNGTGDATLPVTPGAFQTKLLTTSVYTTGAVAKLNADGSKLVYATYLTGGAVASSMYNQGGLAVDAAGEAYITGSTNGVDFPVTPGAYLTKIPSNTTENYASAYVSKLNAAGSALVYSTYLGASGGENGTAIRVDSNGEAWVLGQTNSTNFPVTAGAFQPSPTTAWAIAGQPVGFLAKLSASGSSLLYATYLSGAVALDEDAAGNVYVAGEASFGFPLTNGAFQRCMNGGGGDMFLAEFDPTGELIASTFLGGSGPDSPVAIAALGDGSAAVAGFTSSLDFPGLSGNLPSNLNVVAALRIDYPSRTQSPCMSYTLENGASYAEGPVAPGEIVTIHGDGIGPAIGVPGTPEAHDLLPLNLAGVKVFFDRYQAPLLYVQNGQVNAIVPWILGNAELFTSQRTVVHVEYNGAVTDSTTIPLVAAAPAIFFTSIPQPIGPPLEQAAALNEDGTVNSAANPARGGSVVSLFGTGGGATNPPGVDGALWPLSSLAILTIPEQVQIGGMDAQVLYEGSAPGLTTGIFQMNVAVPATLQPGAAQVTLSAQVPGYFNVNNPSIFVRP